MFVKRGGGMILKNPAPYWGHVCEKSQKASLISQFYPVSPPADSCRLSRRNRDDQPMAAVLQPGQILFAALAG